GGLLAKMLIDALARDDKSNLIDMLILVASPQLGTPKAVPGILHGDEQEIPKKMGFLLNKDTARELGENMESAYTLLPSGEYFDRVLDPVIEFDPDADILDAWRGMYGNSVNTAGELHSFLLGDNGARREPAASDTDTPNVLKTGLLSRATSTQSRLDAWVPPSGITVHQIIGWGLDTIRGTRYTERIEFRCTDDLAFCFDTPVLDREPLFTTDGDKTVVTPSANAMDGVETWWVNLDRYNTIFRINREHADILEVGPIRNLIAKILQDNLTELPSHVTIQKPNGRKNLRISIHSPVSLDIYDSFNNHTGAFSAPGVEFQTIEERIPNSYHLSFGEGTYAGLDIADLYTVVLRGQDFGTFTLIIQEVENNAVIGEMIYRDVPVTPQTTATFTIQTIASSTALAMDMDGDGVVDTTITPGETNDPQRYLALVRLAIADLALPQGIMQNFLAKIDNALLSLARTNTNAATGQLTALSNSVKAQAGKALSTHDAERVLEMIATAQGLLVE
ncbi:MAG: hypothetical protein AAB539_02780, partial [Patescibacteria group bacterium]